MSTSTTRGFWVCLDTVTDDYDRDEYVCRDVKAVVRWMAERGIQVLEADYGCDCMYSLKFRFADYKAVKNALVQCLIAGLFSWCQCQYRHWIYERDYDGRICELRIWGESRRLRYLDTAEKEMVQAGK